MGEQYIKEYSVCCPRTLQKGKHQVEYAKATCTGCPIRCCIFTVRSMENVRIVREITRNRKTAV